MVNRYNNSLGYDIAAAYNAQNVFKEQKRMLPIERLELKKKDAEFKLKVVQDEIKEIDEAIKVLNDSPTTTMILNILSKLGIIS